MSSPVKVTLRRFETLLGGRLPASLSTLYKWASLGTVDWINRLDPTGHRGRELWVDVSGYNRWAEPRNKPTVQMQGGTRN